MYRMISCAAAAFLFQFLAPCVVAPAAAADDIAACYNAEGGDVVAACSRVLARNPRDARAYGRRGRAYAHRDMYDQAIADFNRAISLNPRDTVAYNNRGFAYDKIGQRDRAILDYSQAIRLDPNDATAYVNRGYSYAQKREYDRALADYDQAISLAPKESAAYENRGEAYSHMGEYDRSIADFDQAIRLRPGYVTAYNNRGVVYAKKGDDDRAIADYDQAIRLDPSDAAAYHNRGDAYAKKGENERAIADYDQAIKLNPDDNTGIRESREKARVALARLPATGNDARTCRSGSADDAIAACARVLERDPKDASAYGSRGSIYGSRGEYDRAIADLDEAIKLSPDTAEPYSHRGFAYGQKGDFGRAMADLNKAIVLNPGYARGYTNRASIRILRGDRDLALADLQTALQLEPGLAAAADVQKLRAALLSRPGEPKPVQSAAAQPPHDSPVAAAPSRPVEAPHDSPVAAAPSRPVEAPHDSPVAAAPSRRVALVIGNSAYRAVPALANPRRDAVAVAAALRQAGFQDVELATDLDRDGMVKALRRFRDAADRADWALVYFAGHGIEINRVNYLIPVDAKLTDDRDVKDESISYESLLNAVRDATALRLIVLDACRVNPFKERMHRSISSRSATDRGLAPPPESEPGTLTVYSAKEGDVAEDDVDGANSPFARAFVAELKVPGLEVRRVFDNIRDDVIEATRRRQQPFTYGSLPGRRDFFFVSTQ